MKRTQRNAITSNKYWLCKRQRRCHTIRLHLHQGHNVVNQLNLPKWHLTFLSSYPNVVKILPSVQTDTGQIYFNTRYFQFFCMEMWDGKWAVPLSNSALFHSLNIAIIKSKWNCSNRESIHQAHSNWVVKNYRSIIDFHRIPIKKSFYLSYHASEGFFPAKRISIPSDRHLCLLHAHSVTLQHLYNLHCNLSLHGSNFDENYFPSSTTQFSGLFLDNFVPHVRLKCPNNAVYWCCLRTILVLRQLLYRMLKQRWLP